MNDRARSSEPENPFRGGLSKELDTRFSALLLGLHLSAVQVVSSFYAITELEGSDHAVFETNDSALRW